MLLLAWGTRVLDPSLSSLFPLCWPLPPLTVPLLPLPPLLCSSCCPCCTQGFERGGEGHQEWCAIYSHPPECFGFGGASSKRCGEHSGVHRGVNRGAGTLFAPTHFSGRDALFLEAQARRVQPAVSGPGHLGSGVHAPQHHVEWSPARSASPPGSPNSWRTVYESDDEADPCTKTLSCEAPVDPTPPSRGR